MEKNKTGKYFKYAIGEIILVVIGILIALQINNWNEHNKRIRTQNVYLKQLYEDVTFMKEGYGKRFDAARQRVDMAFVALRYLETCGQNVDDKMFFEAVLLSHQTLSGFYSVKETYDEMLDANILAALENEELKSSIKDLFTFIEFSNDFIAYFRTELGRASQIVWEHVSFSYNENRELVVDYDLESLCASPVFKNALVEVIDARSDFFSDFEAINRKISRLERDLSNALIVQND